VIKKKTVFVLGAGASWHYGYPTGEGLIEQVVLMAKRIAADCDARLASRTAFGLVPDYVQQRVDGSKGSGGIVEGWTVVRNECNLLISRLQAVRPLVIDYFLAWNKSLQSIGRLLITAVILECEARWLEHGENLNRPPDEQRTEDWYRFVVHKLVYGCVESSDLFNNEVRFVTFNYDTSLETALLEALSGIDFLERSDIEQFLSERVIHVYGSVHSDAPHTWRPKSLDLAPVSVNDSDTLAAIGARRELERRNVFLDTCNRLSNNLKTIDPHDKETNEKELSTARQWLDGSQVIYILGFGFDENNSKRIGLDNLRQKARKVMFTNFGDRNTINKKVSNLFFDYAGAFLEQTIHGAPHDGNYYEKSTRTVYEALEMDFDALEA
jgi:hypothetical protein